MNRKCLLRDAEIDLSVRFVEGLRDEKVEESPDRATREVARWRLLPRKVPDSPDSVLVVVTMEKGTGVRRLLRPRCASGSGEKVTLLLNGSSAKADNSSSPLIVPKSTALTARILESSSVKSCLSGQLLKVRPISAPG